MIFLFLGPPDSSGCRLALQQFCTLIQELGVPLAREKTVGPSTAVEFLGIELDSVQGVSRLPAGKVEAFVKALQGCLVKEKVTLHQLQQVVGQLNFALRIIPMARPFSRTIAQAMSGLKEKHHHTRLSGEVK